MNRLLRFSVIGLLLLLAVSVTGGFITLWINLNDDELEPEVARLLAQSPPRIEREENGYFAWIGVAGPETVAPAEWGRRWFEEALAASKARRTTPLAIEGEINQDLLNRAEIPCNPIDHCLEEVAADPMIARAVLAKREMHLARCDAALDYPDYQEPWRPGMTLVAVFPHYPMACMDLQAARFALAASQAQDEEAIAQLEREMAFHVRQLRGAMTLLEKLIAVAFLNADLERMNQYLVLRPDQARRHLDRLAAMLTALDSAASSMSTVLRTEWQLAAHSFLDLPGLTGADDEEDGVLPDNLETFLAPLLENYFYLPNATVNQLYRWYLPLFDAEKRSGESYRMAIAKIKADWEAASDGITAYWSFRNPAGNILVQLAKPNFLAYLKSRDDLIGMRDMVLFQLDLLARDVGDDVAIEQEVAKSGLKHRLSGERPVWNADTRRLFFPDESEDQEFSVAIRL